MTRDQIINALIEMLLAEMPEMKLSASKVKSKRKLLRALMNVRPPAPIQPSFLKLQDQLLQMEATDKGVVFIDQIPTVEEMFGAMKSARTPEARKIAVVRRKIRLWQGDITRLKVDAIVNAANSQLLGCFIPCHNCIDNAIHSAAGLELRQACCELMTKQDHEEPIGRAKITPAFNLPSKFVIHTVGPIVSGQLTVDDEKMLAQCYLSCLKLAVKKNLSSIAFCCISTGEFHFPNERAAQIAVDTVKNFLIDNSIEVVFNVFKDLDLTVYQKILGGL